MNLLIYHHFKWYQRQKVDQWSPEAEVGHRGGQQVDLREFGGVIEMF